MAFDCRTSVPFITECGVAGMAGSKVKAMVVNITLIDSRPSSNTPESRDAYAD